MVRLSCAAPPSALACKCVLPWSWDRQCRAAKPWVQEEEENGIGDVDLFTLVEGAEALEVNAKWLQHLQERLLGEDGHPRKARFPCALRSTHDSSTCRQQIWSPALPAGPQLAWDPHAGQCMAVSCSSVVRS